MLYYDMIAQSGGLKSKGIALSPVDSVLIDYFDTKKVSLEEPVLIEANYYKGDDREDDYVCAGNPQVVSEDFKKLVEELDPDSAQFFTTKNITCTTKKKYYVMHVVKTIDCLDREHSKFLPGFAGKKETIAIGMVDSKKIPENTHLFRLGEDTLKHYVSEKFYKEFKKRKLRGCIFNLRSVKETK